MKKCVVIYNPVSGKEKNKEAIEDFYTILKKYNYDLELLYTKKVGDAKEIVKNLKNPNLVICAGGDGTLNEVISGNLARKDRLLIAHLPLGTTNDVGKMYGYTKDYVKNLELILEGVRRRVDIGLLNNCPFVYVAAFGNLSSIPYDTPIKAKKKYGRWAYTLQIIKEFCKKTKIYNIKYKVEGKTYSDKCSYILVMNSTSVGGVTNLFPDMKLDDKLLEIIIMRSKSKLYLLKNIYYIKTAQFSKLKDANYYQSSHLEVNFDDIPEDDWCVDGEKLESSAARVKIGVNSDSSMLVPTKNIARLFK